MLTSFVFHVCLVAVLALAVGIACRLGRFRPAVCHALWLVVLIKLSLPPVMSWPSLIQEMLPSAPQAFIEIEQVQAPAPAAAQAHDEPSPAPPAQAAFPTPVWRYVSPLLAAVWIIGCLVTLTLHLFRIRGFRSLLKQARPAPEWLQQCSNELAKAFAVRPPTVKVVSGLTSALVWNPWRSKLLVSSDLMNLIQRDEWNGIISHELAHLKRRDLWVGWLELAATCVWWWNPLLILVRRRLHLYAELACDAWVLWALPESGSQYAEVLFKIVSSETRRQTPVPAFGVAAWNAVAFKTRLSLLLQGGSACRIPRKAIAAIVALLLVAMPSLTPAANAARGRNSESAHSAIESEPWYPAFNKVYALVDGEALKLVPPPFIPERMKFVKFLNMGEKRHASEPDSSTCVFVQRHGSGWGAIQICEVAKDSTGKFYKAPWLSLEKLIGSLSPNHPLRRCDIDLPAALAKLPVPPGDWVVDQNASPTTFLEVLEAILRDQWKRDVRFEKKEMERDVVVMSGEFKFAPLPDSSGGPKTSVYFFADRMDSSLGVTGMIIHDMGGMKSAIEECLGLPVVDEAHGELKGISDAHIFLLAPAERENPETRNRVLANLTKQTGLLFRTERRVLPTWTMSEAAADGNP